MEKPKRNRNRAARFAFTLPHPFISADTKIVDIENLTEQQQSYTRVIHDYTIPKSPEYEKFFEFHYVEYTRNKVKDDPTTAEQVIGERIFFKDYDCCKEYFKLIEYIDFFCFQYERGEKSGLLHLQGFLHFKRPMDMLVVHKLLCAWHLHKCDGSNYDCVAYCNKPKTRVDGFDFYQSGTLVEERQRLDNERLKKYIKENTPYEQILEDTTWHAVINGTKIQEAQEKFLQSTYKNIVRDVHVTYIWGKEGSGKTT